MDLNELVGKTSNFDVSIIPANIRPKAKAYLGMILDKGNRIQKNTLVTENYLKDIFEYVTQLRRMGIKLIEEPKKSKGVGTGSGVLPAEDGDEHSSQGQQKPE